LVYTLILGIVRFRWCFVDILKHIVRDPNLFINNKRLIKYLRVGYTRARVFTLDVLQKCSIHLKVTVVWCLINLRTASKGIDLAIIIIKYSQSLRLQKCC
jgi:hypothetical protein